MDVDGRYDARYAHASQKYSHLLDLLLKHVLDHVIVLLQRDDVLEVHCVHLLVLASLGHGRRDRLLRARGHKDGPNFGLRCNIHEVNCCAWVRRRGVDTDALAVVEHRGYARVGARPRHRGRWAENQRGRLLLASKTERFAAYFAVAPRDEVEVAVVRRGVEAGRGRVKKRGG